MLIGRLHGVGGRVIGCRVRIDRQMAHGQLSIFWDFIGVTPFNAQRAVQR
jgi:hypothetical protein